MKRLVLLAAAAAIAVSIPAPVLRAQAPVTGTWMMLPYTMPINPIHLALMNNGNVLVVAGSGNDATVTNFQAGVLDPRTGTIALQRVTWDMFCNGMLALADGRIFVNGGNLQYHPFAGLARSSLFDPASGAFSDIADMKHGRWYPTVTELGDGRIVTYSGLDEASATNSTVEIYSVGTGWSPEYPAGWTPPLYPRMHLLPNGTIFYSGSGPDSRLFNPSTHAWTPVIANTNYGGTRTYGSSVLLPLRPSNGYKPRVMIFGGGSPATATTELIDLSVPIPQWQYGPPMSQPRIEMSATMLPNGKVLTVGGSVNDEDASTASLKADLYDPVSNTFSSAGANAVPRLYHSGSLLLPDATVLLMGGNPTPGNYEPSVELYIPPYLFNPDGSAAARPAVSSLSSTSPAYGSTFQVQTPDAASIATVVLMRPGAPTHAFDTEQRLVELSFTRSSGSLTVTAPPGGNIAPPGYYMLFLLNGAGVPSMARFIRLSDANESLRPVAAIASPADDITVMAGDGLSFAAPPDPGGQISAYQWSFPGATPSSSTSPNPTGIRYSQPGVYVASLAVTNTGGFASRVPDTRIVIVTPDFYVSAAPSSQTVLPGGSAAYSVSAALAPGFSGGVTLGVSGLPGGSSASFNPQTLTNTGSATMTVTTPAGASLGNYPLTITGTSANNSHTAGTTLAVNSCDALLTPTFLAGTLNLTFRLGVTTPATWSTWLVVQNTAVPLWSVPLPAIVPSTTFTLPVAGFPSLGTVQFVTLLQPSAGSACWDVKSVNTTR